MATVINNPQPIQPVQPVQTSSDNGSGFLVGLILLLLLVVLLAYFGLPYLRAGVSSVTPRVSVPDHMQVNIQQQSPAKK